MTARSILKSYFLTGKKPTQGQFAALIDSFLHLSEDSLSISQITNLVDVLAGKASTAQIDTLMVALAAKQDKPNQLISGCVLNLDFINSLSPGTWQVNGLIYSTTTQTNFPGVALCPPGLLKTVAFYGQTDNTIIMITSQAQPAIQIPTNLRSNAALLRWAIFSDSSYTEEPVNTDDFVKKQSTNLLNIMPTDSAVVINWDSAKIAAHGTEPFDIQLYEVNTDGSMQKSTALLTVNAAKTVYSFYVGENSNLNFYYKII